MAQFSLKFDTLTATFTRMRWVWNALIAFAFLFACSPQLKAQTYTTITYPGSTETECHGINAFGEVVGSFVDASNVTHGFIYNAGMYTQFDYPGAGYTFLYGINNSGDIVGVHDQGIPFLYQAGQFKTVANGAFGINNFDIIANGSGFTSSDGFLTTISYPGATSTISLDISDAFEVVGFYLDASSSSHAFFYNGSYSTIDFPPGRATHAWGADTLGNIVGTYFDAVSIQHGFLYSAGTFTTIDPPNSSNNTTAYRNNDFGEIAGTTFLSGHAQLSGFIRLPAPRNPVPHINQAVAPSTRAPNGGGFTLTVEGTGFISGSVVNWNGSALATTFINSEKLNATVSSSNVAAAGTSAITVSNPTPGGGTSNTQAFQVTSPIQNLTFNVTDFGAGSNTQRIIAADFNKDGIMDLAATDTPNNKVLVMIGNGNGTFKTAVAYPVGSNPSTLIAGDFENDGKLDIVVGDGDGGIYTLVGNGDGTFHENSIIGVSAPGPWDMAVGDFNGDGRLDLAVVNQTSNSVSIFLGNGDDTFNGEGNFQPRMDIVTNPNPSQIAVGDFNGDGILDFAVANFGSFAGNTVSVFLGNGNGTFKTKVDYATSAGPLSLVTADFNGDGKLDLAVLAACGNSSPCGRPGVISVLMGNGDGTFDPHVDYNAGSFPYTIVAGDFNGDGKLDLAVTDLDSAQVMVLTGAGDGTFGNPVSIGTPGTSVGIVAADFNHDGQMDIGVGASSVIDILLQNSPAQTVNIASLTLNPTSVLGGGTSTGTVTLSGAAPTGGALVNLASSNTAAATVPASVTVAAGNSSANFTVTSIAVATNAVATITASNATSSASAPLTVTAPTLTALTLSPTSVVGGAASTAKATLSGPAPSGGIAIAVSSSNPSVAAIGAPGNIVVGGGATTGSVSIATQPVTTNTVVTISATLGSVTKKANMTVKAAALASVKVMPTSVTGGTSATATVTLSGGAPLGGLTVTLASSNTAVATVPASVTFTTGQTTATATVQTQPVSPTTAVTISGTLGGVTKTATLTVKAPVLSNATLSPTAINGGATSTLTVKLNAPAPSGTVITLTSSNTAVATVQASVPITAGQTTATATVSTNTVTANTAVHISATYAGVTKTATLNVRKP